MGDPNRTHLLQSYPVETNLFKGIALFTPGGDLVYCIDTAKQAYWHLQLCAVLQEMLGLSEPPHFLVPAYTATIDRWFDPKTQTIRTFAEASPFVLRHQALLNALFGVSDVEWETASCSEELCDPIVLQTYRKPFPQLWQDHDLLVRFEKAKPLSPTQAGGATLSWSPAEPIEQTQGYVFRLFVSGTTIGTERILKELHQLLDELLQRSYTLKIVDIHRHPELAEADQISATPTLLRVWPRPMRRIVGDLANASHLLRTLIVTDWSE
jgi:circadian clock protein KaiB